MSDDVEDPLDPLVAITTFPDREVATRIARALVGGGHAACVNLVPGVRSIYVWKDEVHDDGELLALMKTTRAASAGLRGALLAAHPYDTPEFVLLPAAAVEERYLAWLRGAVE